MPLAVELRPLEDVAATDDDRYLKAFLADLGYLGGDPVYGDRVDAVVELLVGKGLTGEFEDDASHDGYSVDSPTWIRANRLTEMFSPSEAASPFTMSPMVPSNFSVLTNTWSLRTFSL